MQQQKHFQRFVKRAFDLTVALILLIITSPIMLVSIIIVRIKSPEAPAVFKQTRMGYKNKLFTIYKLRTMTNERDENGELLSDEQRTKKWGKFFRTANIDELPQIINILKGEMSWIGPRPVLPMQMGVMTEEEQIRRQSAYPGISGWEAVNEAKAPTREEKAKYDLFYVDNWSLWFDIKIIFKTIAVVLFRLRPDDSLRAPQMTAEQQKSETVTASAVKE